MKLSMILAAAALASSMVPALAGSEYDRERDLHSYGTALAFGYEMACRSGLNDDAALAAATTGARIERKNPARDARIAPAGVKWAYPDGIPSCASIRSH